MSTPWDKLSMKERQQLMHVYVKNGITELGTMQNHYNKFAEGGDKPTFAIGKDFSTYEDRPKETEPVKIQDSAYKGMSYEEVSKYSGAKNLIDITAMEAGVPRDKIAEYWNSGRLLPMMEGRYPDKFHNGLYIGKDGSRTFIQGAKKPNASRTSISRISNDAIGISSDVQETNRNKQIYGRKEEYTLPNLKYGIPLLPETGIVDLGNGSYTTYNALDSLAKYGVMENLTPEEYLGLPWRETQLGRYVGAYAPSDIPQSKRAYYNMNYFNNYGFIPAENLVNDWAYNMKDANGQSVHSKTDMPPLQHAFRYFKSGKYNPGEPGHRDFVIQSGKNVLAKPDVQKWMTQSKYVDHTYETGGEFPEIIDTGTISQGKKWSKFDYWKADHPKAASQLRKAGTVAADVLRLLPSYPGMLMDIYDIATQKNPQERDIQESLDVTADATGLAGKMLYTLYGIPAFLTGETEFAKGVSKAGHLLNIPDKIADGKKFLKDFTKPIEEYSLGGKLKKK